ncbi:MAG TPA: phosphatidate cytidylyltransferase [Vicinamibacteria bacterium]|nr:phosphatidate cytidylyltransferase [Vicinamibacteria bacterium]
MSYPPGFGRNLAFRVATAAVALPALLAVFFLGPRWLGVALVALALLAGLVEFFGLLAARGLPPMRRTGLVLAAAMFLDVAMPGWAGAPLWPFAALLLLTVTLRPGRALEATIPVAALTLLGAAYLGAMGGTIAALLVLPPSTDGPWRVVLLLAIVMAADTLAFFVGHAVGRHRLAPAVSPGKTVEGAVAGVVGGVLGAFAVRAYGLPGLPSVDALALGALVAAMGIVGDLDESLLKRWAGVKDSGTLFPGHGGALDRLDSLLFGAPILYYYFSVVR